MRVNRLPGWSLRLLLLSLLALPAGAPEAATVIKVALITPEGSTWTQTLHRMADEVRERSGGEVRLKIYAGGVSGDELDVLRKMQANRLHAAGFSGVGLGKLLPEVRILEAPLLFESYAETDRVKEVLFDRFAAGFEAKGYVLLGFAEAGFVYFFAQSDLSTAAGLKAVKMWAWKGDPVAQTFLETFGIRTYPLHLADVNTGLETGMIDAFYSPPLAAIAFQWHARVEFMLDYPMVNSTGALLMKKRIFNRLSPEHQTMLRAVGRKYCDQLVQLTRRDNVEALQVLAESGVRRVAPEAPLVGAFRDNALRTYEKSIPDVYPAELLETVQRVIRDFRARP